MALLCILGQLDDSWATVETMSLFLEVRPTHLTEWMTRLRRTGHWLKKVGRAAPCFEAGKKDLMPLVLSLARAAGAAAAVVAVVVAWV